MANDCSVKEFKKIVDNDSLKKFGKFELVFRVPNKVFMNIIGSSLLGHTGNVKYWDGSNKNTEITEDSIRNNNKNVYFYVSGDIGDTIIIDKYMSQNGNIYVSLGFKTLPDTYTALFNTNGGISIVDNDALDNFDGIQSLRYTNLKAFAINASSKSYITPKGSYGDLAKYCKNIRKIIVRSDISNVCFSGTIADIAGLEYLYQVQDGGNADRIVDNWNSVSLRPSSYPIITVQKYEGLNKLWFSRESARNYIINMSNCQPCVEDTDKHIYIAGLDTSDDGVSEAIAALNEKGYSVN